MARTVVTSAKTRRQLTRNLRQTAKTLASSAKARSKWRVMGDLHDRTNYAHLLPAENWRRVKKFGAARVKSMAPKLAALKGEQRKLVKALADNEKLLKNAETLPTKLSAAPGWREGRGAILKKLVQHGFTPAQAKARLERVEGVSAKARLQERQAQLRRRCADLDRDALNVLSVHLAGVFAQAIAEFNIRVKGRTTSRGRPRPDALDRRLVRLKKMIATAKWPRVAAECASLERAALAELKKAVAACAASARSQHDTPSKSRSALTAADAARSSLEVVAICRLLSWIAGWSSDEALVEPWVASAKLAYAKPLSVPAKAVHVAGVVESLTITHVRRKPVTRIQVENGTKSRVVGVPYIKGDSGGIVPGAAVDLQCILKRSVDWLPDKNVYVVQRYALEKSSRTSWRGWMLNRIDQLFSPTANGVAGRWSWEAGKNGAGNPLIYGVWSSARDQRRPYGM